MQGDIAWLSQLLESTAQQLESIAQENVSDPKAIADARRRFMSVLQPVFYWLGDHEPELKQVLDRIGRTFVEV